MTDKYSGIEFLERYCCRAWIANRPDQINQQRISAFHFILHKYSYKEVVWTVYRVDLYHFNADPDPAFSCNNADLDPAFHFNVDSDPAPHQTDDKLMIKVMRIILILHVSMWASTALRSPIFEALKLLNADPDPSSQPGLSNSPPFPRKKWLKLSFLFRLEWFETRFPRIAVNYEVR